MATKTEEVEAQDENQESSPRFAVLFDLENVAAHGREAAYKVLKSILKEHKIDFQPAHFARYCMAATPDQYVPGLLEALGLKLSAKKLAEDVTSGMVMNLSSRDGGLKPGFAAMLDEAAKQGISLAALSALPKATAEGLLKKLGMADKNVQVYSLSDDLDEACPRSDSWLKIAKAMSRPSSSCAVLASNRDCCRAALAAGMRCVAVPDEYTAFQDFGGADIVLDSLEEMPAADLLSQLFSKTN